jgi:integrase
VFAAQDWAPSTRRSYRSAVRGFFGWAHDAGLVDGDPAVRLPVVAVPPGVPRPVPEHVYAAALARADARVGLMLRCAAQAGLRRGEIAQLHSRDVCEGPSLLVHGKGGKDRLIPLPDGLAAELSAYSGWVFASPHGGHVSARWVGQACAAVLDGWSLHSLRHRFATRAYAASHDLRAVQLLLGHTSPASCAQPKNPRTALRYERRVLGAQSCAANTSISTGRDTAHGGIPVTRPRCDNCSRRNVNVVAGRPAAASSLR